MTLRLERGFQTCAGDKTLILGELLDLSLLDLFGVLFDQQWEDMFTKLKEYNRQHGDCLVPRGYKEDPSLGLWVTTQRRRGDELDPTRREKLESIGFSWQVKGGCPASE